MSDLPDMGQSGSQLNVHRCIIEFEDGVYAAKLQHPEKCQGYVQCGQCGADLTDPESTRCYDCKDEKPGECWVQGWFDNLSVDELFHGMIEVAFEPDWDGEAMTARIISAEARPWPEAADLEHGMEEQ